MTRLSFWFPESLHAVFTAVELMHGCRELDGAGAPMGILLETGRVVSGKAELVGKRRKHRVPISGDINDKGVNVKYGVL